MNDHDLLVRIDERVEVIHTDIEEMKKEITSHSRRLGVLERWRAYIVGVSTTIAVLVALITGYFRW